MMARRWFPRTKFTSFGSVAVLNGHIHQVMQKIEGNVAFHTAMSTAFVQPATVIPSSERSLSSGTFNGPGEGAVPGVT
jgi:hypothetical protein